MTTRKLHPIKTRSWKKVLLYVLPFALLILGGLAYMTHAATDPDYISSHDRSFLLEAVDIRMMDWAEGNLAADRGSALYRQYGKQLMHDQDRMMKDLRELATAKKVELPEKISEERTEGLDYLKLAKDDWFDRRFRRMIIKDHKHDIREFKAATESKDPEIREFAKHYLPTLEHHLKMARDFKPIKELPSRKTPGKQTLWQIASLLIIKYSQVT